eukprot:58508_1
MDNLYAFFDGIGNSEAFEFSKAPLSSWKAPVLGVLGYFVLVRVCSKIAKKPQNSSGSEPFRRSAQWLPVGGLDVSSSFDVLPTCHELLRGRSEFTRGVHRFRISLEDRKSGFSLLHQLPVEVLRAYRHGANSTQRKAGHLFALVPSRRDHFHDLVAALFLWRRAVGLYHGKPLRTRVHVRLLHPQRATRSLLVEALHYVVADLSVCRRFCDRLGHFLGANYVRFGLFARVYTSFWRIWRDVLRRIYGDIVPHPVHSVLQDDLLKE